MRHLLTLAIVIVWLAEWLPAHAESPFVWHPKSDSLLLEVRSDTVVTFERTSCMGMCPEFQLIISGDGEVQYVGLGSVREIGHRTSSIPVDDVLLLLDMIEGTDCLRPIQSSKDLYEDVYRITNTDSPARILTVKTSNHYCGVAYFYKGVLKETYAQPDTIGHLIRIPPRWTFDEICKDTLFAIGSQIEEKVNSEFWTGEKAKRAWLDSLRKVREPKKSQLDD